MAYQIAAGLVGGLFLFSCCSCKKEVTISVMSEPHKGVKAIDFVIIGRPKVTRGMHPHSPIFPGRGEWKYTFEGYIQYDGEETRLRTHFEPKTMRTVKSKYFLLTQGYFSFGKRFFQWYTPGKDNEEFVEVNIEGGNERLLYIAFSDSELNRLYKVWCLDTLIESKKTKEAKCLFKQYIAENPRVFFLKQWRKPGVNRSAFVDLLHEIIKNKETPSDLWGSLVKILKNSEPSDDPQDIMILCYTLSKLNPEQARKVISEYYDVVKAANIPDDMRLEGMNDFLEGGQ